MNKVDCHKIKQEVLTESEIKVEGGLSIGSDITQLNSVHLKTEIDDFYVKTEENYQDLNNDLIASETLRNILIKEEGAYIKELHDIDSEVDPIQVPHTRRRMSKGEHAQMSKTKLITLVSDPTCKEISTDGNPVIFHPFERYLLCKICEKIFKKQSDLTRHLATHSDEKPFSCEICHKKYKLKVYLKEHMRWHAGFRPFTCNVCHKKFTRNFYLKQHMFTHTKERPYSCTFCDRTFIWRKDFRMHLERHNRDGGCFSCEICNEKFTEKLFLKNHKMEVHYKINLEAEATNNKEKNAKDEYLLKTPLTSVDIYPMPLTTIETVASNGDSTNKTFPSEIHEEKQVHKKGPFKLDEVYPHPCSKDLESEATKPELISVEADPPLYENLKELPINDCDKALWCNICNKSYRDKSTLVKHLVSHSNEQPFSCNTCNKKFKKKNYLNEHMRIHAGIKPFKCDICNKKFSRKLYLKQHIFTHTGERPFSCETCNKKFIVRRDYRVHMDSHTRGIAVSFVCEICDKTFTEKQSVTRHMKVHTIT